MKRQLLIVSLLLFGCVGCDQVTKQAAIRWLEGVETSTYLADTFRLTYMENHGAFLGMGADWPGPARWLAFTLLSSLMVGVALVFIVRHIRQLHHLRQVHRLHLSPSLWGALLLAAGGIGNLIDRVARDGAVVDFMNLGIGGLRTGIFNVADVQIMAGAALLAFWHDSNKQRTTAQSSPPAPPQSTDS